MSLSSLANSENYSLTINQLTHIPRQNETQAELEAQKRLLQNFENDLKNGQNVFYYIISAKWLQEWKQLTIRDHNAGETVMNDQNMEEPCLKRINEDIVVDEPHFLKYADKDDYRNVFLKEGLQEGRDYDIITETAWKYFAYRYSHITIKRPGRILQNGEKKVEIELKQVRIVPVNNAAFRRIDHKTDHEFKVYIIQVSEQTTFGDFKSGLIESCNTRGKTSLFPASTNPYYRESLDVSEELSRLWILDPAIGLKDFFHFVKKECDRSTSYDYKIEFKGHYLEKDTSLQIIDLILPPKDVIFMDLRLLHRSWAFSGDGAIDLKRCECCNHFRVLVVECSCKTVAYCSEECKVKDQRFHALKCPNSKVREQYVKAKDEG